MAQSPVVEGPSELREALSRVLADVSNTTDLRPEGDLTRHPNAGWRVTIGWGGGRISWSLDPDAVSIEEIATELVDLVQGDIEVNLREPWPKCPTHRHELGADYHDPGHWVCPSDATTRVRIGSLKTTRRRRLERLARPRPDCRIVDVRSAPTW